MSSGPRMVAMSETESLFVEDEVCDRCGRLIECETLLLYVNREDPVLYLDSGSSCICGTRSEYQNLGIPSEFWSRHFQRIEGKYFLAITLTSLIERARFQRVIEALFRKVDRKAYVHKTTATEFLMTGARLELKYLQHVLQADLIQSTLLSNDEWLAQEKASAQTHST